MTKGTNYVTPVLHKSQIHDSTMHQNTVVLMFLKKKTHPLVTEEGKKKTKQKKTSCLKNYIIPERSAAENILSQHCQNHKENRKITSYESCQRLQIKLQAGAKHRTRIKNLLKTYFQKKGRPVLTTVQKRLEQSSTFLSSETRPLSDKQ